VSIIVCRPTGMALRRIAHCSTCGRRRRFAGLHEFWYGTTWTCLTCGERWCDGERMERPFRRGWRQESSRRARALWETGVRWQSPAHRAWMDAELAALRAPEEDR
jgi:hypothetical protein